MQAYRDPLCRSRASALGEESEKPVIPAVGKFPEQQCDADTDAALLKTMLAKEGLIDEMK